MPAAWEPKWHIPSDAVRAAALLALPNQATIQSGLGATTAIDRLRAVRNVVAHSSRSAWRKLRMLQTRTGLLGLDPTQTALKRGQASGMRNIDYWVSDLKAAFRAAVE